MKKKFWFNASDEIRGIPLSRYITSWYVAGGRQDRVKVERWLKSLTINEGHLSEDEVMLIADAAVNGMFELEESAKDFV